MINHIYHKTVAGADGNVAVIANALGLPYVAVSDCLAKHRRPTGRKMNRNTFNRALAIVANSNGYTIKVHNFHPVKGQRRVTARQFLRDYPQGRYILNQAHRFAAVIDGCIHDEITTWERPVYSAWELAPVVLETLEPGEGC